MLSQSKLHVLNVVGFLADLAYSFFLKHTVLYNNLLFFFPNFSLFLLIYIYIQTHEYLKCHIETEESFFPIIFITQLLAIIPASSWLRSA